MMTFADPQLLRSTRIIVLMGVCGCGKTSVGAALAARLNKPFFDADDFHPAANIEKMSKGIPLTDEDRWPWLDTLGWALAHSAATGGMALAACSALRRSYRDRLIEAAGEKILFIFLNGSRDIIERRMSARTAHYMPTSLLDSQFATLEPPESDENAIALDISLSVSTLAEIIHSRLIGNEKIIEKER